MFSNFSTKTRWKTLHFHARIFGLFHTQITEGQIVQLVQSRFFLPKNATEKGVFFALYDGNFYLFFDALRCPFPLCADRVCSARERRASCAFFGGLLFEKRGARTPCGAFTLCAARSGRTRQSSPVPIRSSLPTRLSASRTSSAFSGLPYCKRARWSFFS